MARGEKSSHMRMAFGFVLAAFLHCTAACGHTSRLHPLGEGMRMGKTYRDLDSQTIIGLGRVAFIAKVDSAIWVDSPYPVVAWTDIGPNDEEFHILASAYRLRLQVRKTIVGGIDGRVTLLAWIRSAAPVFFWRVSPSHT